MNIKIAIANVSSDCKELSHYFDKSIPHDWCGEKVSIKSIQFNLQMRVAAMSYSKDSSILATVGTTIVAIITDENNRTIERQMNLDRFKSYVKDGSYSCGWHEGRNKILLNDAGLSLVQGIAAQVAS